jgi:hypothetical protein
MPLLPRRSVSTRTDLVRREAVEQHLDASPVPRDRRSRFSVA